MGRCLPPLLLSIVVAAGVLAACVGDSTTPSDAGPDATSDATIDATTDVAIDSGDAGDAPSAPTIVELAAGGYHACALFSDGHVDCWGDNTYGELGVSLAQNASCSPGPWGCRPDPVRITGISNVKHLALGSLFSCAIDAQANVWCWGRNDAGQLGHTPGTSSDTQCKGPIDTSPVPCNPTPTQVANAASIVQASAGDSHVCVRNQANGVSCWGDNSQGELGDGTTAPYSASLVIPKNLPPAADVRAGFNKDTCAVTVSGGNVWCWGFDDFVQLGPGTAHPGGGSSCISFCAGTPQQALDSTSSPYTGAERTWLGHRYSCMRLLGGGTQCWGGPASNASTITTPLAADAGAASFDTRWESGCTLVGSGVQCWGDDTYGEVGDGDGTFASPKPPTAVNLANGAVQVAAGVAFFVALDAKGKIYGWGENRMGQLGHAQSLDVSCGSGDVCNPTPVAMSGALP